MSAAPVNPARTPLSVIAKLRLAAADIKLAHSVFALPFALLGAVLAAVQQAPSGVIDPFRAGARSARESGVNGGVVSFRLLVQLALIVACMVLARTWAMLVNRLADQRIDAANPRTRRRMLASGALQQRDGVLIACACGVGFVGATSLFLVSFGNPWPLVLSVPVLIWIAFYSFTKRFTALCHVFLGSALAASPLAAAVAINPAALATLPALWLLAGMVLLWVAGFDVIYALQDIEFDQSAGLHSIPAALGWKNAVRVSRVLHAGAFVLLLGAAIPAIGGEHRFGPVFLGATGLVGGLLITEHVILARRGRAGLDVAFFTVNGVVSCVLGVAGIVDLTVL